MCFTLWLPLQGGSHVSSSVDIYRLLLGEEEDDATSGLAAPKPEPDAQKVSIIGFQEVCISLVISSYAIARLF